MSVVFQAEPSGRDFIVRPAQNTDNPNPCFSIKRDRTVRPGSHFFWVPDEVVVGFAITTVLFNSGHDPSQYRPSTSSSGQQTSPATSHSGGSFTSPLNTDNDDGNGDPQQHLHTFDLNCYTSPCHGLCQRRPLPDSTEPGQWLPNFEESWTDQTEATHEQDSYSHLADDCFICMGHLEFPEAQLPQYNAPIETLAEPGIQPQGTSGLSATADGFAVINDSFTVPGPPEAVGISIALAQRGTLQARKEDKTRQKTCDAPLVGADGHTKALSNHKRKDDTEAQTCPECQKTLSDAKALSSHKRQYHSGEKTCSKCLKTLRNTQALWDHRKKNHSGVKTCPQCQKTLPNTKALWIHKRKDHTGVQTCPDCQRTLSNTQSLADHKSHYHTGVQTCPLCQKALPNSRALSVHKKKDHTGVQTCPECQKTLPNAKALSYHKRKDHSRVRICPECQKPLRNAQALLDHKRKDHSGVQTCPECQKTLPNAQALSYHKKCHTGVQTCPECQKTLPNAKALSNHKSKVHTGVQTCPECQKTLPNAKALTYHKSQHRKRKLDDSKSSD
ncbi:C2H2-type zinc finger protein [Endozoicomonas sp. ALC066]|uniref:C2H2-type zinc finger protein n=1 Tax=Endozoicomonas sp. ALC066 TaxID=3403078 RepID=UPI003BB55424